MRLQFTEVLRFNSDEQTDSMATQRTEANKAQKRKRRKRNGDLMHEINTNAGNLVYENSRKKRGAIHREKSYETAQRTAYTVRDVPR